MKIAVIDIYHQFHFELIKELDADRNLDIELTYILKGTEANYHGDEHIINGICHDLTKKNCKVDIITNFLRIENICDLILEPYGISEELLCELKPLESLALRLMDRNSLKTISTFNRKRIYTLLVNYFFNLIQSLDIDTCITFDTPHSTHSVIFYELLRYLGKSVIRLEHHMLPGYSLVLPTYDIPLIPMKYFSHQHSKKEVLSSLDPNILEVLDKQNSFLIDFKSKETKKLVLNNLMGKLKIIGCGLFKVITNLIQGTFPFFFKKEILHFSSLDGISNRFIYRLNLTSSVSRLVKYNLYYNKIAIVPNLNRKYIFFGMHMQPEKTSQPLGLDFDNQLKAIWMLSQALPDNWKLLVKEHPNQFNLRKAVNTNYRSINFYKMLQSIPNVELIQLYVPSEKLIANAAIVATLTGTLGWEGLLQGKPVIAFGDAYYKACKAVFFPTNLPECKEAVERLSLLTSAQVRLYLLQYLKFYSDKKYLVKAANWESKFKFSEMDRTQHIQALSSSFKYFLQQLNNA